VLCLANVRRRAFRATTFGSNPPMGARHRRGAMFGGGLEL
jgi:hypothetical protein